MLSWIGTVLIILGFVGVTYKWKWGFPINGLGSICFIANFWGVDWGVVALNIFFVLACLNGFYQWGKNKGRTKTI